MTLLTPGPLGARNQARRRRSWTIALGLVLVAPVSAHAQLPLPELGPDVRLAGRDPLEDRLEALEERVTEALEDRRVELERAQRRQEERRTSEGAGDPRLDRAFAALQDEIAHLERAQELATDGLAEVSLSIPETIPCRFPELEAEAGRIERLETLAEQREARASRLSAVGARVDTATTASAARLADQLERTQRAEVEAIRAEALSTRAHARTARERADALRSGLRVTKEDLQAAGEALREARAEVTRQREALEALRAEVGRARVRAGSAELGRARLEMGIREVANAEAQALRAQVAKLALAALFASETPSYPPEAGPEAVEAALAAARAGRIDVEARLAEVRGQLRRDPEPPERERLRRQRDILEDVLASVAEESEVLSGTRELMTLLAPRVAGRARADWAQATAWTAVVALLTLLALTIGLRRLLRWEAEAIEKRPGKASTRAVTAAVLILPVVLLFGAAAIIVWPIWQIQIGVIEALEVIDRPLVYVDDQGISFLSLVKLLFTVWITLILSRAIRSLLVDRVFRRLSLDRGSMNTVGTLIHYAFLGVGITIGLRFVGVGLSSFALLAGVLGIGVGFGLRNVTENFISGLIVLFERPIRVGDWITLEDGTEAEVLRIRARSTTVRTRDFVSVIIPNSEFVGKKVTNWSHEDAKIRLGVHVGVVYGSNTDLVRRTLLDVAERHGRVLKRPSPEVQFIGFGDSSLDFVLYVWINDQMARFRILSDLRFAVDAAFRKKNITIAFPQLDLHLVGLADGVARSLHHPPIKEAQEAAEEGEEAVRAEPVPIPDGRPTRKNSLPAGSKANAPARGSKASAPARGSKASAPARGSKASAPARGSETSPPARGSEASLPARAGSGSRGERG